MGVFCCKYKKLAKQKSQAENVKEKIKGDEFPLKRSNFLIHKVEKFKDNYLIGQSMGCGIYSEVRKCKHQKSNALRAVQIIRKDKLTKFETD